MHRFQPTYEELKLVQEKGKVSPQVLFSAYLRGIETLPRYFLFFHIIRFQPTYEELKLEEMS